MFMIHTFSFRLLLASCIVAVLAPIGSLISGDGDATSAVAQPPSPHTRIYQRIAAVVGLTCEAEFEGQPVHTTAGSLSVMQYSPSSTTVILTTRTTSAFTSLMAHLAG